MNIDRVTYLIDPKWNKNYRTSLQKSMLHIYYIFAHKHQIEQCDRHIRSECDVQRSRINDKNALSEDMIKTYV